ncbi:MAG: DUF2244 domain-containing protein [Pseudomonadota bacterium]
MSLHSARIELSPHCSLDSSQARVFFVTLSAGCLGIAAFLSMRGFWPVLPFAGLEMLGLGLALRLSLQRRHQLQTILVSDDEIRVRSTRKGQCLADAVFPRHWSRVKLRPAFTPSHPSRLTVESQRRVCEVGQFLTEGERRDLAARLGSLIGRMGESPPLP